MPFGIVLLLFVYTVFRFLFPSDIPFINDEALLIQRSLEDNARGVLTYSGLMGSRGLDYGPFAIWFYRTCLYFTKNLQTVAIFKMVSVYVLTVGSLYWISIRLEIDRLKLVLLALASPYLWFYSRDLWDNSFVIPLSAGFFASYLEFLHSKKFSILLLALFFLCSGFLTHLVFMPIVLAFAFHFVFFEFDYFKKNLAKVSIATVLSLLYVLPYLLHAFHQKPAGQLEFGNLGHLFMPFSGPRFFTSVGLEYFIGETWKSPIITVSTAFSLIAYILFPIGLANRSFPRILLLSFLFQMLLSYSYRLIPIPNFHSAQWMVYLIGIYYGIDTVSKYRWITIPYFSSLLLGIPVFLFLIHLNGGSRFIHYGATLGNQNAIAKQLSQFEVKEIIKDTFHTKEFPFALDLLVRMQKQDKKISAVQAKIQYTNPNYINDGRIQLVVQE